MLIHQTLPKKTDLASLKSDVYVLCIDKLEKIKNDWAVLKTKKTN